MSWIRNIVLGERGNFKHFLKFPYNILSLIVWNLQKKKKDEVPCMLYQITQVCFNEPD